jgi:drug/metabolite transporter (DMT)-like permease
MARDNLRRGALYMIAAAALFAAMGALVKHATTELANEVMVFFRSAIGLLALLPLLARHGAASLRTTRLSAHVLRGLIGLASMYCFFYALAHMPLAEAVLLNYTAPLFIPLVARVWLGEHASARLLGAVALGFVGVALILKPGLALFTPVSLIALASGVLAALAMGGVRGLLNSEPTFRIVFYYSLVSTLVSALPLSWAWRAPPTQLWWALFGIGVCASLAHLLMTRAYTFAPAAQIGPFAYATILFATALGWGVWGEVPDAMAAAGATIVVIAGVLTIRFGGRDAAALPPARV